MNSQTNEQKPTAKPYPRRCAECGKVAVQPAAIPFDAKIKHDGKVYEFYIEELPVDQCTSCGEVYFTNTTSDAKSQALRRHLGLLQPDEIRKLLLEHNLSQRIFAKHLRIAEETVSRWLNGLSIQSRALDAFMRVYFANKQAREMLTREGGLDGSKEGPKNKFGPPANCTDAHECSQHDSVHPVFKRRFSQEALLRSRHFQLMPSAN
jgi:DNA-binding transcriptional regulator YiaG